MMPRDKSHCNPNEAAHIEREEVERLGREFIMAHEDDIANLNFNRY